MAPSKKTTATADAGPTPGTPDPTVDVADIPAINATPDEPHVQVVMTCQSPMPVGLVARAPGEHVTTDPDTAARLIASGYAVPLDADQEVD